MTMICIKIVKQNKSEKWLKECRLSFIMIWIKKKTWADEIHEEAEWDIEY